GRRAAFLRARGGLGFGGAPRGGRLRSGFAQACEQLLQRPGVLAQRFLAVAPVPVALVEGGDGGAAFAAVALEPGQLLCLPGLGRVQRRLALGDLAFDAFEFGYSGAERFDALHAVALQVAVVGQRARGLGDLVLRQHQLERGVVADGVGGAQQVAQFGATGGERSLHRVAPVAQLGQRRPLTCELGLGLAQGARGLADLLVDLAQLPAGVAAPAFDPAALGGDFLQLAIDLLQLALRVAGALRLRCRRRQRRDQQAGERGRGQAPRAARARHQPGANRLRPVIASGFGRPSRSSTVGATSRSEPPSRSATPVRSPTYTSGTGPTVCAVCGWPVTGSRIISRLPWSAVTTSAPPAARTAVSIAPSARSTACAAWIAACRSPLWPTMSGLAMLHTIRSKRPEPMASTSFSVSSGQLISGCRS